MSVERQVAKRFHAIAADMSGHTALSWEASGERAAWTYAQLSERVAGFADGLRRERVSAGEVWAVPAVRTPDTIAAMLALWELGAAFVPIAPKDPPMRRAQCMKLADAAGQLELSGDEGDLLARRLPASDRSAPTRSLEEQVAYVMFTSGSTGTPKAVAVPHRAIVRLVSEQDYLPFGPDLTFLHAAPLSFDASVLELWGPLLHGGRCAIYPHGRPLTARGLRSFIEDHEIDTAWLTASLFHSVVDADVTCLARLRNLVVGGEQLSVAHVSRALNALPTTRIVNGYGPTENTTFTTCYPIPRPLPPDAARVPIGWPVTGTDVCVVNAALERVATGEEGELVAFGDGLAHGYLRVEDGSDDAFVSMADAMGNIVPAYRTGDRVVQRADGALEFLGRLDDQVKIDGFRVEPGETRAVIETDPEARQCHVICRADPAGRLRLIAYVVCDAEALPMIRDRAEAQLPGYMAPHHWMRLQAMPQTENGKLAHEELPLPWQTATASRSERRSPALAGVLECWAAVLGAPPADVELGLFDAGARSIDAMRLLTKLEQETGLDLEPTFVFEFCSARSQAAELTARGAWTPQRPHKAHSIERQA